jgi:hypothetical protein
MDDSFSTILYIIIAIVAFVISAIGKKKKAPVQSSQEDRQFNEPELDSELPFFRNLEELINEQADEKPIFRRVQEAAEPKKAVQEGRSPFIESNSPLTSKYLIQNNQRMKEEDTLNPIYNDDLTKTDTEESTIEEFDLKQAVISSEILNRKQY